MSYELTRIGQDEFSRVEQVLLDSTESIPDSDYVKFIILETIEGEDTHVDSFSDVFPSLAVRGFRTPEAVKYSRGIFTFLEERNMIENR